MMEELSLNILDIAQNSIAANATEVEIEVEENDERDLLTICVKDNGKGMSEEFIEKVTNPFITTRTTRKVGLGISFLKEAAEMTNGSFEIRSKVGVGTKVSATFQKSHIDRQPLGDVAGTVSTLVMLNPEIDFTLSFKVNENSFAFSTQEVRAELGEDVRLNLPEVTAFISEYLSENIQNLYGGAN